MIVKIKTFDKFDLYPIQCISFSCNISSLHTPFFQFINLARSSSPTNASIILWTSIPSSSSIGTITHLIRIKLLGPSIQTLSSLLFWKFKHNDYRTKINSPRLLNQRKKVSNRSFFYFLKESMWALYLSWPAKRHSSTCEYYVFGTVAHANIMIYNFYTMKLDDDNNMLESKLMDELRTSADLLCNPPTARWDISTWLNTCKWVFSKKLQEFGYTWDFWLTFQSSVQQPNT